jgi:amino acid transporter
MLWVLGLAFSICGLFIWLEFGTMYPRSGGEKVYLEAVYRRPKHLSTLIFAAYAIFLNFSSASCLVSLVSVYVNFPNICLALGIRPKVRLCMLISTPHMP